MAPESSRPRLLKDLLQSLLREWGLAQASKEQAVFSAWEQALGPELARQMRPVAIHQGRLVIAVKDSAWLQELQFMKAEIKKKLNRKLGRGVIQEIKFKLGDWEEEEKEKPPPPTVQSHASLDPETVAEAEEAVSTIPDPALREQVLKALLASARKGSPAPSKPGDELDDKE